MIENIKTIVNNLCWNINTFFKTLFIQRDKEVWLFGSWMGKRFADNSRFLFQYLSENKEKYNIKDVVFVSSSKDVVTIINKMGYRAYLMDSKEGIYYHYKAGVHLICNSNKEDIDTRRSFGAVKIQMWHGNGIKASGKLTRKRNINLKEKIYDKFIKPLLIPGRWYYAHWLACSEESKRVLVEDSGALEKKIIIANSARLCPCLAYLPSEINIIEKIKTFKKSNKKIIMFLPTFREKGSDYVAPLDIEGFTDFLNQENIAWIQKNHFADKKDTIKTLNNNNIISLDSNFDVNVLYDYIDIFISDYSSATTDAIYKDNITIDYCPDFKKFSKDDRGFVADYNDYHVGNFVDKKEDLIVMIKNVLNKNIEDFPKNREVKKFLFDNNVADYDTIVKSIMKSI